MASRKIVTKYKWKIDNFSHQASIAIRDGGSITSDEFSLKGNSKAKFLIKIESHKRFTGTYTKRRNPKYTTDTQMSLICSHFGRKNKWDLNVKIWQENSVDVIGSSNELELNFDRASTTYLISQDVGLCFMGPYAIDDVLFICCEIEHEEPVNKFYENDFDDENEELAARSEFGQSLFSLHSEGHFDLKIQVEDKEFKASKLTLMACSEVFRRMLSCPNSIEATSGVIQIENTKPEIIDALLRWIYQVEVGNMEEIVKDLYKVADKYSIGPLKKKCVKLMIKSLSKENLMTHLTLAYIHNEDKLKQCIIGFLNEDKKNLRDLMASDEWFKLCGEDPDEAKKILVDIYD